MNKRNKPNAASCLIAIAWAVGSLIVVGIVIGIVAIGILAMRGVIR